MIYFADWKDDQETEMLRNFAITREEIQGCEILFAVYTHEDYAGDALVIFRKDGKLYEVNAGHHSHSGLEGQWEPEETTVSAMKVRDYYGLGDSDQALTDLLNKLEGEGM